jgi:hypothetical protein
MTDKPINPVLPKCAAEYIDLVAKKVRYRRRVRAEVRQELIGHFEDALHGIADEQQRVEKAMSLIKEFGDAKTLAILIRRGKKRCRPLWLKALIRICQAAGIAILVFTAYMVWFFSGVPYISVDYVAEMNQLVRPTADENLNADPYYEKAASLLKPIPSTPNPWESELTAEQLAAGRQWVAESPSAVELIRKGNERPYAWRTCYSPDGAVSNIKLPELGDRNNLGYFMAWQAWLDAQDGNYNRAFDDIKQCYLMGCRSENKGPFVAQLLAGTVKSYATRAARSIIAMPQVKADSLTKFQTEYENLLAKSDFHLYCEGESMFIKDSVQRTFTKSGRVAPLAMARLMFWSRKYDGQDEAVSALGAVAAGTYVAFLHPDKDVTLHQAAGFYDKAQQVASVTPYQARDIKPTLSEVSVRLRGMNALLRVMLPDVEKVTFLSWARRTDCHALLAQIAVERYKRDKGPYPESLEVLQQAGYLKELPLDPWSDKPLVYRKTTDGYTLYSVGKDFIDGGGKPQSQDWRQRQRQKGGWDFVFWPIPRDGGGKK